MATTVGCENLRDLSRSKWHKEYGSLGYDFISLNPLIHAFYNFSIIASYICATSIPSSTSKIL